MPFVDWHKSAPSAKQLCPKCSNAVLQIENRWEDDQRIYPMVEKCPLCSFSRNKT